LRKWVAMSALVVLVALVSIQLVPVDTGNPPVSADVPASPAVKAILRRACYDCHSNETAWPWYARIAPVSWFIARDVHKGRAELNFSTWNEYSTQQRVKKLRESWQEVAVGEMPTWLYRPIHRDAGLTAEDRALLLQWAREPSMR
jgi:Haem-binding domain